MAVTYKQPNLVLLIFSVWTKIVIMSSMPFMGHGQHKYDFQSFYGESLLRLLVNLRSPTPYVSKPVFFVAVDPIHCFVHNCVSLIYNHSHPIWQSCLLIGV